MTAKVTHIPVIYIRKAHTLYIYTKYSQGQFYVSEYMYLFYRRSSSHENTACIYDIAITALHLTLEKASCY